MALPGIGARIFIPKGNFMKKTKKIKVPKNASRRSVYEPALPDLVSAMMKLVERLEAVEQKVETVLGRISELPSALRVMVPQGQTPQHSYHAPSLPRQEPGHPDVRRERMMFGAVCADCCKPCEVPFKPTADRPVYCKECFAIRKAGHTPQDPDRRSQTVRPLPKSAGTSTVVAGVETKKISVPSSRPSEVPAPEARKQKPVRKSAARGKRKRRR